MKDCIIILGKMAVNITSSVAAGRRIFQCRVDTCLKDVVVQFFRGPELLDSTTDPMQRGWLGTLKLKSEDATPGDYVCQAMSDSANLVLHQSISHT